MSTRILGGVQLAAPNNGELIHGADHALYVRELSEFQNAIMKGLAFAYSSTTVALDVNADTAVFIVNNSTELTLVVEELAVQLIEKASIVHFHFPAYAAANGTAMTPQNLNRAHSNTPDCDVHLNDDGNTQANIFHYEYGVQYQMMGLPNELKGNIRLGYHECVAVDVTLEQSSGAHCYAVIYFVKN